MKRLHFDYCMRLAYSEQVQKCHFTVKCLPQSTDRQKVEELSVEIQPQEDVERGTDSFGNQTLFGSVTKPHDAFSFHMTGRVVTGLADTEAMGNENILGAYRYPYGLTIPGEGLKLYFAKLPFPEAVSDFEWAVDVMHRLYRDFSYEKNVTGIYTTAEEAWQLGKGVCQDYAHILVTLCRMAGIPARYVTGMLIGEGYSHAWAEILSGDCWHALDPANDCIVDDTHIKIGIGRDASDCMINRGVMLGGGVQTQEINVRVEEEI